MSFKGYIHRDPIDFKVGNIVSHLEHTDDWRAPPRVFHLGTLVEVKTVPCPYEGYPVVETLEIKGDNNVIFTHYVDIRLTYYEVVTKVSPSDSKDATATAAIENFFVAANAVVAALAAASPEVNAMFAAAAFAATCLKDYVSVDDYTSINNGLDMLEIEIEDAAEASAITI